MERNSVSGIQSQNRQLHSRYGLSIEPLGGIQITSHQPSLYTELSTEKYNHLLQRVKYHESQLRTIESNILDCVLKLETPLKVAKQEVSSRLSTIQEIWGSLMNEVDNKLNSIYEVFAPPHSKLYDLMHLSKDYLQTHQENPDACILNAIEALSMLKITDLPSFDTEIMYTLEQDKIKLMKAKLDDLLTEVEKCKSTMRISANLESEDKYVVIIEDRKLTFETKEGYITSFLGETQLHTDQSLNHPEDEQDLKRTTAMDIEQDINPLDQAEDKKKEIPCLDIPIDQNICGPLRQENSVPQAHEYMPDHIEEECKSHDTANKVLSRNPSDEDYKSSTIKKPLSLKSKKRKINSRNKRLDKDRKPSSQDLRGFIVPESDSDQTNLEYEWSPGPELKSQVLNEYKEDQRKQRQQRNNTSNKRTKRFRAS